MEIESTGSRYESFKEFIAWASKYDEAGIELRSKKLHESWLSKLYCPILKLEEDITVEERVNAVIDIIHKR